MSFGTIIKKLRRERDLTQEELAENLSISPQAISRWETDVAMPDISLLPILCNYFVMVKQSLKRVPIITCEMEQNKFSVIPIVIPAGKMKQKSSTLKEPFFDVRCVENKNANVDTSCIKISVLICL